VSTHAAANGWMKIENLVTRFFDELSRRPAGKETEMSDVQGTDGLVIEVSGNDLHSRNPVDDVGKGDHQVPILLEQWTKLAQHAIWRSQVFENVTEKDHIKCCPSREAADPVGVVEVSLNNSCTESCSSGGSCAIVFHSCNPATLFREKPRNESG
jgi:hypothetical protein